MSSSATLLFCHSFIKCKGGWRKKEKTNVRNSSASSVLPLLIYFEKTIYPTKRRNVKANKGGELEGKESFITQSERSGVIRRSKCQPEGKNEADKSSNKSVIQSLQPPPRFCDMLSRFFFLSCSNNLFCSVLSESPIGLTTGSVIFHSCEESWRARELATPNEQKTSISDYP